MAAGFPKRMRLRVSGNYSSSGGSIDLNDDVDEVPPPISHRRHLIGQKTAMRMSRGLAGGSANVQSRAPSSKLVDSLKIQATNNLYDVNPIFKMKLNIAMPVDNDGDAIEDGAEDSDE